MPLMPGAEYVGPIPSTNYANSGGTKIGTATHVIVGSAGSALGEFQSQGAELSSHFIIVGPGERWPDGHILQVLDTDLCCYAQAAGNYAPTAYIAKEFAGDVGYPMSAAQLESSAQIDAWAATIYAFPLVGPVAHGQPGLIAHCNPDGSADPNYGNHVCPGPIRLAQIPGVAARARQIAGQGPGPSPTPVPLNILQELLAMTDNGAIVRMLYILLLKRRVDANGYAINVKFLANGGTVDTLIANLGDSPEGVAALQAERKSVGLDPKAA
jgi:hypothetical protein